MDRKRKSLKILKISYDWRNIFENNFIETKRSLERDRLAPDLNRIFLLQWAPKSFYARKGNIETVHIRGVFGRFRMFYDFLSFFIAPFVLFWKKFQPDIFLIREFPLVFVGLPLKIFFGTKTAFFLGSMPSDLAKTRRFGFLRWGYHRLSEIFSRYFVNLWIANGIATRDYLVGLGAKKEEIKIMVEDIIARDKTFIDAAEKGRVRRMFNIGADKKIILSVGRLEKEKGFERLLNAFKNLKKDDLVLVIAGDGVLKENLKKQAEDFGMKDRVFFAGLVTREEIWSFYKDADVFILLSYSEGSPTVFREAMYMNVPVIGSKISAIAEFIGEDGERGFLWDEGDGVGKLTDKINFCLDKNKSNEMIKKASAYITENVSGDYIINDFI